MLWSLPPQVSALTDLRHLDVSSNCLSALPEQVGTAGPGRLPGNTMWSLCLRGLGGVLVLLWHPCDGVAPVPVTAPAGVSPEHNVQLPRLPTISPATPQRPPVTSAHLRTHLRLAMHP